MGRFGPPPAVPQKQLEKKSLEKQSQVQAVLKPKTVKHAAATAHVASGVEPKRAQAADDPLSKNAKDCKLDAARAVGYRESLLMHLNAVVVNWPAETKRENQRTAEAVRLLTNLSKDLREAGLMCVEKIVAWVLEVSDPSLGPTSFMWNGSDYLLKMVNDLDFVAPAIGTKAWSVGRFCRGNPLLLSEEEMAGRGAQGRAYASRIRAASMVLLDVARRKGLLEASVLTISIPAGSKPRTAVGNSSPRMKSGPPKGIALRGPPEERTIPKAEPKATGPRQEPVDMKTLSSVPRVEASPRTVASSGEGQKKCSPSELESAEDTNDADPAAATTSVRSDSVPEAADFKESAEPIVGRSPDSSRCSGQAEVAVERPLSPPTSSHHGPTASRPKLAPPLPDQATSPLLLKSRPASPDFVLTGLALSRPQAVVDFKASPRAKQNLDPNSFHLEEPATPRDFFVAESKVDRSSDLERSVSPDWLPLRAGSAKRPTSSGTMRPSSGMYREPANQHVSPVPIQALPLRPSDASAPSPRAPAEAKPSKGYSPRQLRSPDSKDDDFAKDDDSAKGGVMDERASPHVHESVQTIAGGRSMPKTSHESKDEHAKGDDGGNADDAYREALSDEYGEEAFEDIESSEQPSPAQRAGRSKVGAEASLWGEWRSLRQLGEGNYGDVFEVEHRGTGVRGALKRFKDGGCDDDDDDGGEAAEYMIRTQRREIALSKKLSHPGIVKLLDSFDVGPHPVLVFELMPMNLLEALQLSPLGMPQGLIQKLVRQLCAALSYCHDRDVVHRDLKPENILVSGAGSEEPVLKLCDFGASRELRGGAGRFEDDDLTNYVGSRWYRAPESLANRTEYGLAVDCWAVACITAELGTGSALFRGDDEALVLASMVSLLGPPPPAESAIFEAHDLAVPTTKARRSIDAELGGGLGVNGVAMVRDLLRWDPLERPTMGRCLFHVFLLERPPSPGAATVGSADNEGEEGDADECDFEEEAGAAADDKSVESVDKSVESVDRSVKSVESAPLSVRSSTVPAAAAASALSDDGLADMLQSHLSSPSPPTRLAVVVERADALESCCAALDKAFPLGHKARALLCPYYLSPFGKKVVDGRQVEEGEGLGPRKELFALASEQLQRSWRPKGAAVMSGKRGQSTVVVEGIDAGSILGHRLVFGDGREQVERTVVGQGDLVERGAQWRLDAPLDVDVSRSPADLFQKQAPLLTYIRGSECLWLNETLHRGPGSERLLRGMGLLLGLTVLNKCLLDLRLPALFFRALLDSMWSPTLADLLELDPSFGDVVNKVNGMGAAELDDVDACPAATLDARRASYLSTMVVDYFQGAVAWQLPVLRDAFFDAIPKPLLEGVSPQRLLVALCGIPDDPAADFNLRKVFLVREDAELTQCPPLRDAFWATIDGLSPTQKRQFVLFVTGVSRLPSPGTERLTVEMPFFPLTPDDHRKALLMVPQSHTCDNVLELPNYWQALVATNPGAAAAVLVSKLTVVLKEKVDVACANAAGYSLDGLESDERLSPRRDDAVDDLSARSAEVGVDSSGAVSIPMLAEDDDEEERTVAVTRQGMAYREVSTSTTPVREAHAAAPPVDDSADENYEEEFDEDG